jgi:GH15 family glucan-1,4-alpha-glucosidase
MRDTYYIPTAFNNIGHFEEMERYFHHIANISTRRQVPAALRHQQASELVEQELDLAIHGQPAGTHR